MSSTPTSTAYVKPLLVFFGGKSLCAGVYTTHCLTVKLLVANIFETDALLFIISVLQLRSLGHKIKTQTNMCCSLTYSKLQCVLHQSCARRPRALLLQVPQLLRIQHPTVPSWQAHTGDGTRKWAASKGLPAEWLHLLSSLCSAVITSCWHLTHWLIFTQLKLNRASVGTHWPCHT